jgi:uncharacterized protein YuzE
MEMTYGPRYNIAYISFRNKAEHQVQSLKISEEVILDISSDGEIYGIELLNANRQLKAQSGLTLKYINEATGEKSELKLTS